MNYSWKQLEVYEGSHTKTVDYFHNYKARKVLVWSQTSLKLV